jgi:hypothetical protein
VIYWILKDTDVDVMNFELADHWTYNTLIHTIKPSCLVIDSKSQRIYIFATLHCKVGFTVCHSTDQGIIPSFYFLIDVSFIR